MRVVSLLPAATEIVGNLGLLDQLVGVSHECDYPPEVNDRPRVTHCAIHQSGLPSAEVDRWVRDQLTSAGTLYTLDEALLRRLRPCGAARRRTAGINPAARRPPTGRGAS